MVIGPGIDAGPYYYDYGQGTGLATEHALMVLHVPGYDQTPVDGCFLEIGIDLSPMG
jgi:hypothetical protein